MFLLWQWISRFFKNSRLLPFFWGRRGGFFLILEPPWILRIAARAIEKSQRVKCRVDSREWIRRRFLLKFAFMRRRLRASFSRLSFHYWVLSWKKEKRRKFLFSLFSDLTKLKGWFINIIKLDRLCRFESSHSWNLLNLLNITRHTLHVLRDGDVEFFFELHMIAEVLKNWFNGI